MQTAECITYQGGHGEGECDTAARPFCARAGVVVGRSSATGPVVGAFGCFQWVWVRVLQAIAAAAAAAAADRQAWLTDGLALSPSRGLSACPTARLPRPGLSPAHARSQSPPRRSPVRLFSRSCARSDSAARALRLRAVPLCPPPATEVRMGGMGTQAVCRLDVSRPSGDRAFVVCRRVRLMQRHSAVGRACGIRRRGGGKGKERKRGRDGKKTSLPGRGRRASGSGALHV